MSKILTADDSSTVHDEVTGFLKEHSLAVDTAVDGKDGPAKVKADPGVELVISDVNMPNMDGSTVVEKIRGGLGNKTVNVIMLTTESSPAMEDRGKAAGMEGWIIKPLKSDVVLETSKRLASRETKRCSRVRHAQPGVTGYGTRVILKSDLPV